MNALKFYDLGASVLPLLKNSKRPATAWSSYRENRISKDKIECHNGNFGIVTGRLSGLTVVDADNDEAIRWVEDNLPKTPLKVETSRGRHYYFRWNGETNSTPERWPNKIDLRGEGGYVVAPGSSLDNGFVYTAKFDDSFESFKSLPFLSVESYDAREEKKGSSTLEVLKGNLAQGKRNNLLSNVAYRLAISNFKYSESLAIINALNDQQETPLSTVECYKLVEGKFKLKAQGRLEKHVEVDSLSEIIKPVDDKQSCGPVYPEPVSLLKDLRDYVLSNSFMLQPAFALGSALGVLSALSSNVYKFDGKAPNLYLFAVGKSGTGKNDPMRIIKDLLAAKLGRPELVGAGKYASSVSIIEDLPAQRQRIDVIDEASAQFEMATKFGAGSFQSSIIETLNELYTASLSRFAGERSRTHGVTGACWNPCLSLYATTTPEGFKSFFSRSLIAKGIGGRLSLFLGLDRPQLNTLSGAKTFANKEMLSFMAARYPLEDSFDSRPLPAELMIEDNAGAYWQDYKRNKIEHIFSINDDLERTIHAREVEQANKFTQLHAIGRNLNPRIEIQDIDFGTKLAKVCLSSLYDILIESVAQNKHEAMIKETSAKVKALGSASKKELQRELKHFKTRELEECLTTLIDIGEVTAVKIAGGDLKYCHKSALAL